MRRILCAVLCVLLMCIPLCGCEPYKKDSGRLSIVVTSFPPYDFARAVAGDSADITMLLSPGAEAHSYEPTPLDIARIQQCDVFVYIGGEDEVWVEKILDSLDTSSMTVVCLFDCAELLCEEEVEGASPTGHHHHDHDEDHDHDEEEHGHEGHDEDCEYDDHIWTSPQNAILCVNAIADALCGRLPASEKLYRTNASVYTAQLTQLDSDFAEMTENAAGDTIVLGDRFPFRYLTHEYGLHYYAAFSGCSSESEPGVYTMAFLINEILEHGVDTVFYLDFSTKRISEKLCDATGAQMLPLWSCHNVSREQFDSGVTYIDLMRENLSNIKEALD